MVILPAKLTVPVSPVHVTPRPRLLSKLRRATADCLVLCAPAGYGKSTLAAQLVSDLPVSRRVWYTLDRHDGDPRRFIAYLTAGLSKALPILRRDSGDQADEREDGRWMERVDDLCFLLHEHAGRPIWLVLDNWEAINESEGVREIVTRLLEYSGSHLKIVIASRCRPRLDLSRRIAQGRAVLLEREDLAFTLPEFKDAMRAQRSVPEEQLEALWHATGGWCVCLGLLMQTGGASLERQIDSVSETELADNLRHFVREEILKEIPPEMSEAFLHTALLPELSVPLCEDLLGSREAAGELLEFIRRSSIPHVTVEPDSLLLHPVVRDAARHILADQTSPDELRRLSLATAESLSSRGFVTEAVELLLEQRQFEDALEVIDRCWEQIVESDNVRLAGRWLDHIPATLHAVPRYVKLKANVLSLSGRNRELIDFLGGAFDPSQFQPGDATICSLWIRLNWARLHTFTEPLYDTLRRDWEELRHRYGPFGETMHAWAELTLACGAYMEMRMATAIEHIERCLELLDPGAFISRVNVQDQLAIFMHARGATRRALSLLDELNRECEKRRAYTGMAMRWLYRAWLHISIGQIHQGLADIEQALDRYHRHEAADVRTLMYADRYRGIALWYLGQRREGMEYLERALASAEQHNPQEAPYTRQLIAYYRMLAGEKVAAVPTVGETSHPTQATLAALTHESYRLLSARQADDAAVHARRLLDIADRYELIPWTVTARFLLAWAADQSGDTAARRTHLRQGLETLTAIGWASYPMAAPDLNARVFVWAAAEQPAEATAASLINGDVAVDLIPAFREALGSESLSPEQKATLLSAAKAHGVRGLNQLSGALRSSKDTRLQQAAAAYLETAGEMPLPPLRVTMLGGFAVEGSAGAAVEFSRRTARAMFQILVLHHPNPVHEEVVMEHLWPGGDLPHGRTNLRTTVKELRQALDPYHEPRGRSYIRYDDEHYSLELPDGSSVDVSRFLALSRRIASSAGRSEHAETFEQDCRTALALYRGELLPHQRYDAFTIEPREMLHNRFLDVCARYADHLVKLGRAADAIPVLERALEMDPLWGDGVQKMMEVLVATGQTVRALRLFRQYEERLARELDVPPDEQLVQYYTALTSGKAG